MKVNKRIHKKGQRGQSTLEIALILPVLILLLLGVVEAGFGLRNYILIANANREAARFAARAAFTDDEVANRLISAAGTQTVDGERAPFLRIEYPEDGSGNPIAAATPNAAIIITHVIMDSDGHVAAEDITRYTSGVVPCGACEGVDPALIVADGIRVVDVGHSRVDTGDIEALHGPSTQLITAIREDNDFEGTENHIVVIETYFMHQPFAHGLVPSPWLMYTHTEARVIAGR